MERAQRQRSDRDTLDLDGGAVELERVRLGAALEPARHKEQHRLGAKPPHGEGEHRGRRGVEPLDIVYRQRHPRLRRQRAKEPEEAEGHRALVRQRLHPRPEEQRLLERRTLRLRKRL